MQDKHKTKQRLIEELVSLRAQLELKKSGDEETVCPEGSPIIPMELYAMIFDQFPLGISVIRKDGFLIYVNPAFVKLTGYTLPDIDREKKWFQKAYPDKECRRKALYVWVKYQTQQVITEKVFQVTCKDGKSKSIEFNMIKVSDGSVVSMMMDVTGHGEAEELLREKEEQWRLLLDTMNEGFITFNALGIPVFVNHRFCEMTGFQHEELIDRPASAFLDAENLLIFQSEFFQRSSGRSSPYEIVFRRKDGSPINFLVSPRPLYDRSGRFVGSIGTCSDITERKTMEEALRQSEERYRTILTTIEDGYNEVDLAGRFTFFNESFQKMMGYDRDELLGMHYRQCADKKNQERVYKAYHQVYKTGTPLKNFEWEVTRKDGITRIIEVSVSLIRDAAGCPKGFRGIVRDITDRKEMDEALRQSEEKYRAIFNNSTEGIYRVTPEGRFIIANPAAARILGYESPEELISSITDINSQIYAYPEDRDRAHDIMRKNGFLKNFEVQCRHKDGSIVWVLFNANLVRDEQGNILYHDGTSRDINARKRAEEELNESNDRLNDLVGSLTRQLLHFSRGERITSDNGA